MKSTKTNAKKRKSVFTLLHAKAKKQVPGRSEFLGPIKIDIDPMAYQRQMRDEW